MWSVTQEQWKGMIDRMTNRMEIVADKGARRIELVVSMSYKSNNYKKTNPMTDLNEL